MIDKYGDGLSYGHNYPVTIPEREPSRLALKAREIGSRLVDGAVSLAIRGMHYAAYGKLATFIVDQEAEIAQMNRVDARSPIMPNELPEPTTHPAELAEQPVADRVL